MEEVGEIARIMPRQYGEQSYTKSDTEINLADEMADILFVLICLATKPALVLMFGKAEFTIKTTGMSAKFLYKECLNSIGDIRTCLLCSFKSTFVAITSTCSGVPGCSA